MKGVKGVLNYIFVDGLSGMALGLFATLEKGIFADIKRGENAGKGLSGVVVKSDIYFNPFIDLMLNKNAEVK